jgi:hypothetical protein
MASSNPPNGTTPDFLSTPRITPEQPLSEGLIECFSASLLRATSTPPGDSNVDTHRQGRSAIQNLTPRPISQPWNPAALLNPRQHAAAQPKNIGFSPSTNGYGANDAVVFQFSNPHDVSGNGLSLPFPAESWPAQEASSAGLATNGMATFIERANNVQDRTIMPQSKRRKIDSPELAALQANGASGSGMLGQYVREKREEESKNAPAVQTVDLTEGMLSTSSCLVESSDTRPRE